MFSISRLILFKTLSRLLYKLSGYAVDTVDTPGRGVGVYRFDSLKIEDQRERMQPASGMQASAAISLTIGVPMPSMRIQIKPSEMEKVHLCRMMPFLWTAIHQSETPSQQLTQVSPRCESTDSGTPPPRIGSCVHRRF